MHEPLRRVAQKLVRERVDLLGEQAHIVCDCDQLVHQSCGLVGLPDPGERVGEPERAAEEGALAAAQPVLAAVAREQRTAPELPPYGLDRPRESIGMAGLVAEQDSQKQARVELFAAGLARVTSALVGPAVCLDEV